MPAPALEALPRKTRAALDHFTSHLASRLGEALTAVMLYGGVVKGRYDEHVSDLNVLVILREITPAHLDELAAATTVAKRDVPVSLLTVAEHELPDCVEVFAVKFFDILQHHHTLHGPDILATLAVSRERITRQARRELVNLKLRVRQAYLQRAARPEALAQVLQRGRKTLAVNISTLQAHPDLSGSEPLRLLTPELAAPEAAGPLEERCALLLRQLEAALAALGPA